MISVLCRLADSNPCPGEDLGGWIGWLSTPPLPPRFGEAKHKTMKAVCYYGRNKDKLSGQVPHFNFYFVALLVVLMKQFLIRFQFSDCYVLETCPIDWATPRYQPRHATLLLLKHPGSCDSSTVASEPSECPQRLRSIERVADFSVIVV